MRLLLWSGVAILAGLVGPAAAQQNGPANGPDESWDRPTEEGIRLTPEMARAAARQVARQVLVKQFELEESKVDQAVELMARRAMQLAHEHEEAGQDLIEFAMTTMMEEQLKRSDEGFQGMPETFTRGVGQRMLPLMPSIREMTNGVMEDVRPMLSFKQQLKFTGEIALANVALDAFEKNMQKWSTGEADPFGNPFQDGDSESKKKDANGQTQTLKVARKGAERRSQQPLGSDWEVYVKEAKQYYQMDESQAAAADSLLREYRERAKVAIGGEVEWRKKVYANGFWQSMSLELPGRWWGNPLFEMLRRADEDLRAPVEALGEELKGKIDEIPTQGQRDAATARMEAAFEAKGLKMEDIKAADAAQTTATEGGQ